MFAVVLSEQCRQDTRRSAVKPSVTGLEDGTADSARRFSTPRSKGIKHQVAGMLSEEPAEWAMPKILSMNAFKA